MSPRPRKQFAQHWLQSDKALDHIIRAAELSEGDRVLEIGPGKGVLTQRLLSLVSALVAVEIDRDLCALLAKKLGQRENFLLLQGDFLDLELAPLLTSFPNFQNLNKVVANIPYNITGPILAKLLGTIAQPNSTPFDSIVLLVQKEVAERICAQAGHQAYGALSVRVQYLATCDLIATVPAKAFYPPPKVDSAIIRLRPRLLETLALNARQLEVLVALGFSTRRKMLRNNLKSLLDRDEVSHLLEKLELSPQARAEDLSVTQWVTLSNHFQLLSPAPSP